MAKKRQNEDWQKRLEKFYSTLTPNDPSEMKPDPRFTERHEGTTPLGGDYSIAYYYDADHKPCEKAKAKFMNIVIYDKDGRRINEVYGNLG